MLFAALVDDPSAFPEEFPTAAAQQEERQRLFAIITELVQWENANNAAVLDAARREIARSLARAAGLALPVSPHGVQHFLAAHAPVVLDPFCGGGSIPLEAQRLGLRVEASDLNSVAVLITRALVELPAPFAGRPPVNPRDHVGLRSWQHLDGLAADVRYYGAWLRDQAQQRIGHLYPKVTPPRELGGGEATVVAWLWARTARCPNPACGAQMPLLRSFALCTKKGRETWAQPVVDKATRTVRFEIRTGGKAIEGTVSRRGARCLVCGAAVAMEHLRAEGQAGRLGRQLVAVVAEGARGRCYLPPTAEQAAAAAAPPPEWAPEAPLPEQALGFRVQAYGLTSFADLFTPRQLAALDAFSALVPAARERALADGADPASADAIATYLALAVDRLVDRCSTLCTWNATTEAVRSSMGRAAMVMTWEFAEANPFSASSGNFAAALDAIAAVLAGLPAGPPATVASADAATASPDRAGALVCTDLPAYSGAVSDLSDFFYVWLRRSLRDVAPDLFRTVLTPKGEELTGDPGRSADDAEAYRRRYAEGLRRVLARRRGQADPAFPLLLQFASRQQETAAGEEGEAETTAPAWEAVYEALSAGGWALGASWPLRSTPADSAVGVQLLVCRPRSADAPTATRSEFLAALGRELPAALRQLQAASVPPAELAQAAAGAGMRIYTRHAQVLAAGGDHLPVREALALINQELDAFLTEQEGELDEDTRCCLAWFDRYGLAEGPLGEADLLARARNTSLERLEAAGLFTLRAGAARLRRRAELDPEWDPRADHRVSDWKCLQQLLVALYYDDPRFGGEAGVARLVQAIGAGRAETARDLAYALQRLARRHGWADEARAYAGLIAAWPAIQQRAAQSGDVAQRWLV